jgi:glycosyltransferase involved in cell wall biosynthesis
MVSFIIPTYNRASFLERALLSIIKERDNYYPNIEIIIIDGASKDSTKEILRRYKNSIAYSSSELDKGPYDAFGKGIKNSKGEIIRYFADDDELIPCTTSLLVNNLNARPEIDVVGGISNFFSLDKQGTVSAVEGKQITGYVSFKHLAYWGMYGGLSPECCFFRRELFNNMNPSEIKYRYACDLEFWLYLVNANKKIFIVPQAIVNRYIHPESVTVADVEKVFKDGYNVLKNNAGFYYAIHYYLRLKLFPKYRNLIEFPFKVLGFHPLKTIRKLRKYL